jgi:phytoene desaturase
MARVTPQLVNLKAHRSVFKTVARYIKDEQLRQAFSFHTLLVGGDPYKTSSIYTLIHYLERHWGVFFPRGGTGALVQALVRVFTEIGGRLELCTPVDEILTQDGKISGVRTPKGQWACDIVVSNADVVHSYSHLLRHSSQVESSRRKALRQSQSMSLFLIYFGTNRQYPNLAHHNILFGRSYREVLKKIFGKNKEIPDDFSLYLHAPSRSDPSMAPEGGEAFYVLSPVPHLGNLPIDWKKHGQAYADKIIDYIEKRYAPGLRSHIVTQRIFTPEDFRDELNAHLGAAFSTEPVLWQSAAFRTRNRDPDLKGMYFVGAGTHPGAGVPGVVNSAKATANLLLKDLQSPQWQASL